MAKTWTVICIPVFIQHYSQLPKGGSNPNVWQMNEQTEIIIQWNIYSVLKRKEILIHATTRIHLENIMWDTISQTQKNKCCVIPLIWGALSGQIHRGRKQSAGCPGLGGQGSKCLRHMELQFGRMKRVPETDGGGGWTTMWMYLMPLNYILKVVKMVNFVLCTLPQLKKNNIAGQALCLRTGEFWGYSLRPKLSWRDKAAI